MVYQHCGGVCVCVCVISVNTVGVLCNFGRAVLITICQKKNVTAIVNLRSTGRYFDPPPYNSVIVRILLMRRSVS